MIIITLNEIRITLNQIRITLNQINNYFKLDKLDFNFKLD